MTIAFAVIISAFVMIVFGINGGGDVPVKIGFLLMLPAFMYAPAQKLYSEIKNRKGKNPDD